jgi:predicted ArsR family transcriptional regulator
VTRPPSNKGRRVIKINALTQARLIEAMLDGTMSIDELAEHTGLHAVTVQRYTRELHRVGAVHIAQWEKDARGRDAIRIFKIGRGRDAKREKLTASQRQKRSREKKRAIEFATIWR